MKIKYLTIPALVACISLTITSCNSDCEKGSGKQTTEARKLAGFTKLDIAGGYKVNIKQDTGATVSVTGDDNLMQYIKTDVSGDKLTVKSNHAMCPSGEFTLNITVKNLSEIKTSGSVNLVSDGKLTIQDLKLNLSGSSKINLDMSAGNVVIGSSGISDINLTGQATSNNVDFSGSGKLNAFDFVVGKYTINSSGSSQCRINVLSELNVSSSGASDVEYKGNPANIHNDKSGASTLKKVN